jgi:DNA-binding NarL/FixJ family response regulator
VRLGLLDVLGEAACECVAEDLAGESLIVRADAATPDAVVVDWDTFRADEVLPVLRERYPAVTVIECSNDRLAMRVVPGRPGGDPYEATLSASGLVRAVRAAAAG